MAESFPVDSSVPGNLSVFNSSQCILALSLSSFLLMAVSPRFDDVRSIFS